MSGEAVARSMGRWQRSSSSGTQSSYTANGDNDITAHDTQSVVTDTGLCLNAWPHLEPFTVPSATATTAATATSSASVSASAATQSSLWTTAPLLYSTDTAVTSTNSGSSDAPLWQVYEGDSAGGFGTCRCC
jgi:hypothetical protein